MTPALEAEALGTGRSRRGQRLRIAASFVSASALSIDFSAEAACRRAGSAFACLRAWRSFRATIFAARSAICWSMLRRWRSCCSCLSCLVNLSRDSGAEIWAGG
jgi:hypothetical protein